MLYQEKKASKRLRKAIKYKKFTDKKQNGCY